MPKIELRQQLEALAGTYDQTMRCEIIRLVFADEAKARGVTDTEAFRLWCIDRLDSRVSL